MSYMKHLLCKPNYRNLTRRSIEVLTEQICILTKVVEGKTCDSEQFVEMKHVCDCLRVFQRTCVLKGR